MTTLSEVFFSQNDIEAILAIVVMTMMLTLLSYLKGRYESKRLLKMLLVR